MSYQYDQYLGHHKVHVLKAKEWLINNLPGLFGSEGKNYISEMAHDSSKKSDEEYYAYDAYFYGGNRSAKVVSDFQKAWLHHIHNNPHHWQHWVLLNDEQTEGEIALQMPPTYVIEMVCDWWSFSWEKGDLFSVFGWWDEHKDYIKLNPKTREYLVGILTAMHEVLSKNDK